MNLKLPKSYKLFLAICVVAGPIIWLVLTEDGKRRSDLFLLHVLGHQPFNLAVENLRPGLDEEFLLGQFSRVDFACDDGRHALGERRCAARIGSFNGIPARRVELYWNQDQAGAQARAQSAAGASGSAASGAAASGSASGGLGEGGSGEGGSGHGSGADSELNAMRLDYRERWHALLVEELRKRYGDPRRDIVGQRTVLAWRFDGGMLLIPKTLADADTPTLMWVREQS